MNAIDVLVVETVPLLRDSIRDCLERDGDIRIVSESASDVEQIDVANSLTPDVVVVDMATVAHETTSLAMASQIKNLWPQAAILALVSSRGETEVFSLVEAGVVGLLRQTVRGAQLAQAVRTVHAGEMVIDPSIRQDLVLADGFMCSGSTRGLRATDSLTERERQVLRLTAGGMRNTEVAARLMISERTVRTHLESIFSKFGARSRTEAVLIGLQRGWVSLTGMGLAADTSYRAAAAHASGSLDRTEENCLASDGQLAKEEQAIESQEEEAANPLASVSKQFLNDLDEGCLLVQGEKYVFVNSKMADTLGYAQKEMVGKSVVSIVPHGLQQAILRLHRMRLAGLPVPSRYDLRCVRKGGETIPARLSVKVTRYQGGKAVVGVFSRSGERSLSEASILRWLDRLPSATERS